MSRDAPVVLRLAGRSERDGHRFWVGVEDPAEEGLVWLRPRCSCGWSTTNRTRYTLEENAHWRWFEHVKRAGPVT